MNKIKHRQIFFSLLSLLVFSIIVLIANIGVGSITFTCISLLLLIVCVYDIHQEKHSLLRNYPLIGRLRWVFEAERTKIQQYFK
jgi:hypothetical protein